MLIHKVLTSLARTATSFQPAMDSENWHFRLRYHQGNTWKCSSSFFLFILIFVYLFLRVNATSWANKNNRFTPCQLIEILLFINRRHGSLDQKRTSIFQCVLFSLLGPQQNFVTPVTCYRIWNWGWWDPFWFLQITLIWLDTSTFPLHRSPTQTLHLLHRVWGGEQAAMAPRLRPWWFCGGNLDGQPEAPSATATTATRRWRGFSGMFFSHTRARPLWFC